MQKGAYGYIASSRKRFLAITAALLFVTLSVFFTGRLMTGTNRNVLSLVAAVLALPTGLFAVRTVMLFQASSCPKNLYDKIEEAKGGLFVMYDLMMTSKDQNYPFASVTVLDDHIIGILMSEKVSVQDAARHIRLQVALSKYHDCDIRVTKEENTYLQWIRELEDIRLATGEDPYEKEASWQPGTVQTIAGILKSISL